MQIRTLNVLIILFLMFSVLSQCAKNDDNPIKPEQGETPTGLDIFEQNDLPYLSWCYWEFNSGFGIFDPNTNTWRIELMRALLPDASLN